MTAPEAAAGAGAACVWERHKQNPGDVSLFSETASLLYVPTAAGGKGRTAVQAFLERALPAPASAASQRVVSTVVGEASLVEESVFDDSVTCGNSSWICPGAELKNVIGRRVRIPMVTVVVFAGDKIESKRVYWDQASVLAQIGVLSPALIRNNDLPVLVAEEADLIEEPENSSYNKLAKLDVTEKLNVLSVQPNPAHVEEGSVDIFTQGNQPVQYRLSSRVLQPGGTGGTSSVFSNEPEPRKAIPADPRRYETHIMFGDDQNRQQEQQRAQSASAVKNMNSHFQFGQNDNDAEAPPITTGKKVQPDKTNASHFSLNGEGPVADEGAQITGTRKKPVTSNPNLVSQIGLGAENLDSPVEQPRLSSRVTRPPGGGSSITLG